MKVCRQPILKVGLLFVLLACCALSACKKVSAAPSDAQTNTPATKLPGPKWKGYPKADPRFYPKASRYYTPKKFDARVDATAIAILCDPGKFNFSIRAYADKSSVDRSYPERWLIKKDNLVEYYPAFTGEKFYREYKHRTETCGPFLIRIEGDALNVNANGEMGAEDSFANVSVVAGNYWMFPARQLNSGGKGVKLFHCAVGGGRQSDCPDSFATQIDAAYDPKFDALHFLELLEVYEDLGGPTGKIIKRTSKNDQAWLNLYWTNR